MRAFALLTSLSCAPKAGIQKLGKATDSAAAPFLHDNLAIGMPKEHSSAAEGMSSPQSTSKERGDEPDASSPADKKDYTLSSWNSETQFNFDGDPTFEQRPHNSRPTKKMRTFTSFSQFSQNSSKALPETDSPEYQHNIKHSGIHQMPAELMLEIIDYISLDTTSILCMQLVARDFYPLVEVPVFILPEERDAFKAALRRDDLRWFSTIEHLKGLEELPKAVCSACGIRHEKARFTPGELAKDPQQRKCISADVTVLLDGRKKLILNDIFDSAPEQCGKLGISASYVSKSAMTEPLKQAQGPILETIIAHVSRPRELEVSFHFRHSAPCNSEQVDNGPKSRSWFTDYDFVCPRLQASLLRCEPVTEDRKALKGLKANTFGKYPNKWFKCVCETSICNKAIWSESIHVSEAENRKEMLLSICRTFPAEDDYMGADWHKFIMRKLARQQVELNAKSGDTAGICLYEAKEKGEWSQTTLTGRGGAF